MAKKFEPIGRQQVPYVFFAARIEVIKTHHIATLLEKPVTQVRAKESCAPCYSKASQNCSRNQQDRSLVDNDCYDILSSDSQGHLKWSANHLDYSLTQGGVRHETRTASDVHNRLMRRVLA
jgi:hypothetical protein